MRKIILPIALVLSAVNLLALNIDKADVARAMDKNPYEPGPMLIGGYESAQDGAVKIEMYNMLAGVNLRKIKRSAGSVEYFDIFKSQTAKFEPKNLVLNILPETPVKDADGKVTMPFTLYSPAAKTQGAVKVEEKGSFKKIYKAGPEYLVYAPADITDPESGKLSFKNLGKGLVMMIVEYNSSRDGADLLAGELMGKLPDTQLEILRNSDYFWHMIKRWAPKNWNPKILAFEREVTDGNGEKTGITRMVFFLAY
jgi:hypothetical protein